MGNECHFCRGIVSAHEAGDLLLEAHGDHRVVMHEQCADGHGLVEERADGVEVTCPECGAVETLGRTGPGASG